MLPARLLQSHNLANTSAASGVFEKFQGEKPPMTRERNRSSDKHKQSLIGDFRQAVISGLLLQSCLEEEATGWATSTLQQQQINATLPNGWCPVPAFSIKQAAGKLKRIDDTKRSMSDRTASTRKGAIAHCTPTCSILQAGACLAKMQATSGQRRSREQNASCMAARRQASSGASMVSESHEKSQR